MAFEESESKGDFPPAKKYQGNWKCSECGGEITELPFDPDPDRPVYCIDCLRKRRDQSRRASGFER